MTLPERHLRFEDPDPPDPSMPIDVHEDPPEPTAAAPSTEIRPVIMAEIVPDPMSLIPTSIILQRMEGITAAERAEAALLGRKALSIVAIHDDATEETVGALIDVLTTKQEAIERKVNPFATLANTLHKALTGFRNQATQELAAGLAHLKPMLAQRLRAKRDAEEERQRQEREKARKVEQDRLQAEADHLERVGESPAVVEQVRREAETVAAPPVAERPITAVKGASTRDNWKCELIDKRAVIAHVAERLKAGDDSLLNLLDVNTTTANQLARAQKNTMKIPGLRAVNDVSFTKRRSA